VAGCLSAVLKRPSDFVARYGGEEFAAILPATDHVGTCHVAEALRQAVEHLAIDHAASPTTDHVTISLGAASVIPAPGCHPSDLVCAADQALYAAKQSGRNRWCYQGCQPDSCIHPLT
jgi:diguanylate cyclase (GGDEF)-like protein